jgi:hypothetical protein
MKPTLSQYFKGFTILRGVAAGVPFVPPLLSVCLPDSNTFVEYLYPPVGDFQRLGVAATVGFLLLTTVLVFRFCRSIRIIPLRAYVILVVGFVIGVCGLIAIYVPYVARVELASVNQEVLVSIGGERTEFARKAYQQKSDDEMLQIRGPWETEIKKLWTLRSIVAVRTLLWLFYTSTLSCFLSVASLAAYQLAVEEPPGEPTHP